MHFMHTTGVTGIMKPVKKYGMRGEVQHYSRHRDLDTYYTQALLTGFETQGYNVTCTGISQ